MRLGNRAEGGRDDQSGLAEFLPIDKLPSYLGLPTAFPDLAIIAIRPAKKKKPSNRRHTVPLY